MAKAETIRVGMTASLSGRYCLQGQQALVGIQTWIEVTNNAGGIWVESQGKRCLLHLAFYDDASLALRCGTLMEHLITSDRVDVLFGPYSSGLALRAAAVATHYQRVLWNHGGALSGMAGSQWVINLLTPARHYFYGVIDLMRATMPAGRHLTIVHSTAGAFPQEVAQGAASYARARDFETVQMCPYPAGTIDFSPWLRPALQHHLLLGVGRIEDDLRLATQYVQSGVQAVAVGLIATPLQLFADTLGTAAGRFLGPSQWEPGVIDSPDYGPPAAEVQHRLSARQPLPADYPMTQAYAAGLVAQRCIEAAGTLEPAAIRDTARQLDFTTFYGRYKLNADNHQIGHLMPVVQWQNGQKVILWPPREKHLP